MDYRHSDIVFGDNLINIKKRIILNYKLQITNHKSQITNHKLFIIRLLS